MIDPAEREKLLRKLKQSNEIKITVTGRKTKKKFTTPVWFALDGEKVLLVPVRGSDSDWFKDLANDPQVELGQDKTTIRFKATLVRDSNRVENVLDKFRAKYKSEWSESYYTKRDAFVEVPL